MIKSTIITGSLIFSLLIFSCNNTQKDNKVQKDTTKTQVSQTDIKNSKGYKLMQTKCFVCHFEKPDMSKPDKMLAPPMLRVKEHYLPTYPNKEDFIQAIVGFVKNPSEEKTLMPGAVKKFNLMPKLVYDDQELRLIAETIYNYDFGKAPKGRRQMTEDLKLNNGQPWKLKKETIDKFDALVNKINDFKSAKIEDYNQFGKELFEDAKFIMLDKSYTGEKFEQIHNFFNGIEDDMHSLIAEKSIENAKKTVENLKIKLANFHNYFKAE